MANYEKMLDKLNEANALITAAEECLLPTDTLKLMDGYLIGYLRCCKLVNMEAQKAIRNSAAYKKRKKKDTEEK
jgi:hypothetical protein